MARDYILPARGPTSDVAGRENAYRLPVPWVPAKTLGLKAGNVLGMMVVLSDRVPAAKAVLFSNAFPACAASAHDADAHYSEPERDWWAMQGLNLRPLPCEGSALPLS